MISNQTVHTARTVLEDESDILCEQSSYIINEAIRAGIMEWFRVPSIETGQEEGAEQEPRVSLLLLCVDRNVRSEIRQLRFLCRYLRGKCVFDYSPLLKNETLLTTVGRNTSISALCPQQAKVDSYNIQRSAGHHTV